MADFKARMGFMSIRKFREVIELDTKLKISYSHLANILARERTPDHPAVLRFMGIEKRVRKEYVKSKGRR